MTPTRALLCMTMLPMLTFASQAVCSTLSSASRSSHDGVRVVGK